MLRTKIDSYHGLRFLERTVVDHDEVTQRDYYLYNKKIDSEINAQLRGEVDNECDYLEPTVIRERLNMIGFIDLFEQDCSHGFTVHSEDEVTHELKAKASRCYPVPW